MSKNLEMRLCRKLQIRVPLIKADLDECFNVLYNYAKKVIKEGQLEGRLGKQFDCMYQTEETDWPAAEEIVPACNWVLGQSCI